MESPRIVLVEEHTEAGVIVRAVRSIDRAVLAERFVLRGRSCFRRRLTAARRALREEFPASDS